MNRVFRTSVRAVLATLLASLVWLAGAPTAAFAANDRLLVSNDGVNFVADSTFGLFTSMGKVVPGDRHAEHVWVMNNSSTDAVLRIDMVNPSADDAYLAEAFSLNVIHGGGSISAPVTIAQGIGNGECTVLDTGIPLGAGERVRLDFAANVDAGLTERQGALGTVKFQLRGVLIEAVAGDQAVPGSKCAAPAPDVPNGDLTNTGSGSTLVLQLIAAAAVLAGTTFGLLAWRRRRRQDESEAVA